MCGKPDDVVTQPIPAQTLAEVYAEWRAQQEAQATREPTISERESEFPLTGPTGPT